MVRLIYTCATQASTLTQVAADATVGTVFVLVSILLVDRFGRRTLFRKSLPGRVHTEPKELPIFYGRS